MKERGRAVLITGAKGGLGTFVTQAFLNNGDMVGGVSRSMKAQDFSEPERFEAIAVELSTAEAAIGAVDRVVNRFGRLDVVVHVMGGWEGGAAVADTDEAVLERMLAVNLRSTFHLLRAAIPALRAAGGGRIIGVGSKNAVEPGAMSGAYSASKAAMLSLLRTVAAEEEKHGIRANVVLPGTMDTPANRAAMPKADFAEWTPPADVASLILWLASPAAQSVNGAAIPVYRIAS